MAEDYGKMKLRELRQRIKDGDEDAAAYLTDRTRPIFEGFQNAIAPLARLKDQPPWEPPKIELPDMSTHEADLDRISEEVGRRRAAEVERQEAMRQAVEALRDLAQRSAEREINAENRERRMQTLMVTSVVFGAIAALGAVAAVVVALVVS